MTDQEHARAIAEQIITTVGLRPMSMTCVADLEAQRAGWVAKMQPIIAAALTRTADTARAQGRQAERDETLRWAEAHELIVSTSRTDTVRLSEFRQWLRARATPGDTP